MVAIRAIAREGVCFGTGPVRFGSEADMCAAKTHDRFGPESRHCRPNAMCSRRKFVALVQSAHANAANLGPSLNVVE